MPATSGSELKSPIRDEAVLIAKVLAGTPELFAELVGPYHRVVFLTAYAILRNQQDAEDVSQEAILKAFRHLAGFRGEAKFSTWLIQITSNESRLRLRRERKAQNESIDEMDEDGDHYCPIQLRDWREVPSEALENQELRAAINKALLMLPEKYREILVLRDIQQLNIEETVKALGISQAQVKTRLHRARLLIRDILAPQMLLKRKPTPFLKGLNPWR